MDHRCYIGKSRVLEERGSISWTLMLSSCVRGPRTEHSIYGKLFHNGKLIPARIPLSALVAGPMAGYPYSNASVAAAKPRFVSRHYYDRVCPKPFVLSAEVVRSTLPEYPTALQVLDAWVEKLQSIEDRCVEIEKNTHPMFDIWYGRRVFLGLSY